jgi:predicted transposase YbfD/YdcC
VTLGQVRTADKSNEITAIPELLDTLDVKGVIITVDAMGCQHDIAAKIITSGADYVLGVKNNQPGLAEAVKLWFDAADTGKMDRPFWDDIQTEKDHGRIETRRCLVTNDVAWLGQQNQHWAGLKSLIMIESTREIIGRNSTGTASVERRYYISSLPAKAAPLSRIVRAQWGIENSMHWVLDVAFREDDCRIRVGDAAQNFAILRRIALNLLKKEKTTKLGINAKRLKAGWNVDYLGKVLGLVI